jgi:hypothetical protein
MPAGQLDEQAASSCKRREGANPCSAFAGSPSLAVITAAPPCHCLHSGNVRRTGLAAETTVYQEIKPRTIACEPPTCMPSPRTGPTFDKSLVVDRRTDKVRKCERSTITACCSAMSLGCYSKIRCQANLSSPLAAIGLTTLSTTISISQASPGRCLAILISKSASRFPHQILSARATNRSSRDKVGSRRHCP